MQLEPQRLNMGKHVLTSMCTSKRFAEAAQASATSNMKHARIYNTTIHVLQCPGEHDSFPPCSMHIQVSKDQQANRCGCLLHTPIRSLAYPSPLLGPPTRWPHYPDQSHNQTAGFPACQDSGSPSYKPFIPSACRGDILSRFSSASTGCT